MKWIPLEINTFQTRKLWLVSGVVLAPKLCMTIDQLLVPSGRIRIPKPGAAGIVRALWVEEAVIFVPTEGASTCCIRADPLRTLPLDPAHPITVVCPDSMFHDCLELAKETSQDIQSGDWVIFRMENTPGGKNARELRRFRHPELLKPVPYVRTSLLARVVRYLTLRPVTFFSENSRNFAYTLDDLDWEGVFQLIVLLFTAFIHLFIHSFFPL
jgi:hypothetical protein